MKIEAGKFYRTRDGKKVGPMSVADGGYHAYGNVAGQQVFSAHYGTHGSAYVNNVRDFDLVSEWIEPRDSLEQVEAEMDAEIAAEKRGPVRTVTRKEIVPGYYGSIEVTTLQQGDTEHVGIRVSNMHGPGGPEIPFTASELRAAAATLTEIAEALSQRTEEAGE